MPELEFTSGGGPMERPVDPLQLEAEPWTPPETEPEHCHFEADDGVIIHYLKWPADEGAPVLLMLHGRRAHAHWFDPIVPYFAPKYLCVSMDLRGHGESGSNGPASLQHYTADLAQLMSKFSDRRVILLAHSMAGRPAILANQEHGRMPDLLVMADTPLYRRPHHSRPERPLRPRRYPTKEIAASRFRLMPKGTSAHPDLLRYIGEKAVSQDEDGSWGWKFDDEGTSRPFGADFPEAEDLGLEQVTCPTLIIHGERSRLFTAPEAEQIASRFPNAKVVELADTYHHLMLDRPREFSAALLEFFGEHGF